MTSSYKRYDRAYDYDPNEDYMEKMQEAAARGDYEAAARYEQQRNEKIRGEGLNQYAQTNDYAQYLPKTTAQQMDEILKQYQERAPFSFDLNQDALFQQYRDIYAKQGQLAMEDARGQAAALTGGYGNSYAETVGQQAYMQELDRLTQLAPTLYAQRKAEYEEEGNKLLSMYSLLADKENTEYARDQYAQSQEQAAQDKAYELTLMMLQNGMMPSDAVLSASGLSEEDAKKIYQFANANAAGGSSSGGGGSSRSSSSKGTTAKALPNTEWNKLYGLFDEGQKTGDLTEFEQYMSMKKAQGYDVDTFSKWALGSYKDIAPDLGGGAAAGALLGIPSQAYNPQKQQTQQGGVSYSDRGMDGFADFYRRLATESEANVADMLDDRAYELSEEQWKQVEALLKKRGITG